MPQRVKWIAAEPEAWWDKRQAHPADAYWRLLRREDGRDPEPELEDIVSRRPALVSGVRFDSIEGVLRAVAEEDRRSNANGADGTYGV